MDNHGLGSGVSVSIQCSTYASRFQFSITGMHSKTFFFCHQFFFSTKVAMQSRWSFKTVTVKSFSISDEVSVDIMATCTIDYIKMLQAYRPWYCRTDFVALSAQDGDNIPIHLISFPHALRHVNSDDFFGLHFI